jgi:hypothetical protein
MMEARTNTFDGNIVSVMGNKLVMTSVGGKERSYTVAADARVTARGKTSKTEDLKAGTLVRVTTKPSDRDLAIRIETVEPDDARANTQDGNVVSMTGDKLVMTNQKGKEQVHTLAADARVTSEGTARKATDLKPGMSIRVTTKPGDMTIATGIEFGHRS